MTVKHLNQAELADRWDLSQRTLERWRAIGWGPCFLKIGGRVVYRLTITLEQARLLSVAEITGLSAQDLMQLQSAVAGVLPRFHGRCTYVAPQWPPGWPHESRVSALPDVHYQVHEHWQHAPPNRNNHWQKPASPCPSCEPGTDRDNVESPDTSGRLPGEERGRIAQKIPLPSDPCQLSFQTGHLLIPRVTASSERFTAPRIRFPLPAGQQVWAYPQFPSHLGANHTRLAGLLDGTLFELLTERSSL